MEQNNTSAQAPDGVTAPAPGLAGKSILLTGGASGLGAALCTLFARAGAYVMVADLQRERALGVVESLRGAPGKLQATGCDVGNPDSAAQAVAATLECYGRLDILINNAGTDVTCAIDEISEADWDRVIRTNLYGPFMLSRHAVPVMKKAGGGHIVNIVSTAAKRAWPNASAYHASKWGLLGLSHALHAELRPANIKVTAVIAGGMRTPFLLDRFPDIDLSTLQDPMNVAKTVESVLLLPPETVIPEIMVLPMRETSWP